MKFSPRVLMLLSCLIAVASMLFRRPDAFYAPQFWGEEGSVFYAEAYHEGFSSLFNTCVGYFHLYPRLIACTASALSMPLQYIPFLFCFSWLAMLFLVLYYIWKRLDFSSTQLFFISIAVVMIPLQSEVFMNLTNVQWIMALFPIIIFSSSKKRTRGQFVADSVIMILAGFTGPNFAILLPALVIVLFMKRKELFHGYNPVAIFIWIICGLTGLISLLQYGEVSRVQGTFFWVNTDFISVVFVQYAFLFIGKFASHTPLLLQYLGVCAIIGLGLWATNKIRLKPNNTFELLILLGGVIYLASGLISYRNNPGVLSPYYGAARNFYIPALTFVWLIIRFLESKKFGIQILTAMIILFAAETIVFVGSMTFTQYDLKSYDAKLQSHDTISIPINPEPWTIEIDNRRKKP